MNTFTVVGAISGNCEVGNCSIASIPMNTVRIEMTMARTGRWMKFLNMDRKVWDHFTTEAQRARRKSLKPAMYLSVSSVPLW